MSKRFFIVLTCAYFIIFGFSHVNAMCDCFGLCSNKNKVQAIEAPTISFSHSQEFFKEKISISLGQWSTAPEESIKTGVFKNEFFLVLADGHGGDKRKQKKVKKFVSDNLIDYAKAFVQIEESSQLPKIFECVDIHLIKDGCRLCGSTASFVWISGKLVHIATVGDSRVLWCGKNGVFGASVDHRLGINKQERERIKKTGFAVDVEDGKLFGLEVSRSFGISGKKGYKNFTKDEFGKSVHTDVFMADINKDFLEDEYSSNYKKFGLSSEPDCISVPRENLEFIVVASRALWNCMSSEEVATFVCEKLGKLKKKNGARNSTIAEDLAKELTCNVPNEAIDNVDFSVAVMLF